jgi:hypothetical protein
MTALLPAVRRPCRWPLCSADARIGWRLFYRDGIDGLFGLKDWGSGFRRQRRRRMIRGIIPTPSRTGYVGAGLSARTMARSRSASGQAEANATRMRVALSMMRAATLISRRRRVVNSALARAAGLRDELLDAPQQPVSGCVQDQAHLDRDITQARASG